ncbi:MAG: hypothetical protein ACRBBN_13745 [Methyloligellaceae bacterium]
MRQKLLVALFSVFLGFTFLAGGAQASQFNGGVKGVTDASSLIEQVTYRRCRYHKIRCTDRWGYKTRRYYRCMVARDCGHAAVSRCTKWKVRCGREYGYKSRRYWKCLRRHDCR